MFATAPGKLILTGEYAVLDGAPAIVVAVDRRAVARRGTALATSPFLLAVADELAASDPAAAEVARHVTVDTSALYAGERKLGLGSSAAATVAATACAGVAPDRIYPVALAAHARAQGLRGARGSGADVAAAVHGGTIAFEAGAVRRLRWPTELLLVPFSTGVAADTATLVARVMAVRTPDVTAALAAIAEASRAAETALDVQAFARAGAAVDQLARATQIDLVPACVVAARHALARLGGTAKTTGAGGGDVGVAVLPATVDATEVGRLLIEVGCQPLRLSVDATGVDTRPAP
jgi:phosphomevalonate kinase